jgi:hypothetical protein
LHISLSLNGYVELLHRSYSEEEEEEEEEWQRNKKFPL